ncbi:M48 family metalloprotease [Crossiella sp. CA198]|uniref:M48 family metalloprotease n=1 Tax=Crossiella sp. CA198 TaxID=3455607 RepID=UPI003F8D088A
MFDHFAWSVLATPVLVVLGAWLLADRLRPDLAARTLAWATVIAAWASTINLFVFALKALAEIPEIAGFGGWSHDVVVADTAHVPWVSWVSLVWTILLLAAVAYACRRRRRALRFAKADTEGLPQHNGVVTVHDDRIDAYALPGAAGERGRIVITTGMVELLGERQRAAVIAHERAHLDGGHQRLVWLASLAAIMHPLLRPVAKQVAYLVERAADEAAAEELGDRREVAKALGHAALASARQARALIPHRSLAALGAQPGVVPRRVAALLAPGEQRRWASVLLGLVAVGTVVWTGECVYDLFELLELASR